MKTTSLRDEPLVRFVVLGALVFAADRALAAGRSVPDAARRVEISPAFVEGLHARHAARSGDGAAATSDEALVHDHVREEVLYREAVLRDLDRGDLIVRRRMVQAMELVLAAEVDVPEPDDATLAAFLDAHQGAFAEPARTSLEHLFFARTREHADADASAALAALASGADAGALGDAFLSGRHVGPATDARLDATFGEGFAARLTGLAEHTWSGPLEGALGLHLVRIESRTEPRAPALADVRSEVELAWSEAERDRLAEASLAALVATYEIVHRPESE